MQVFFEGHDWQIFHIHFAFCALRIMDEISRRDAVNCFLLDSLQDTKPRASSYQGDVEHLFIR